MVKKLFAFLILAGFASILFNLYENFNGSNELNRTAKYYAQEGPHELNSANLVTSVVVTYRGLDTLGEVTILFLVASIIGFFLKSKNSTPDRKPRKSSELLKTGTAFLVPLIFLLGVYVFINGHLSPGGGFQGGAIIASGTLLFFLADPYADKGKSLISVVESISGLTYVGIGIAGLIIFGSNGFLDNRILPLGSFGSILSAGAIPLIYSLIGLKVGSELSAVLYNLKDAQEES